MIKPVKKIKDVFISEPEDPAKLEKVNQPLMLDWIKNRLKEKTTWRGIFTVLGVAGVSFAPEMKEAIIGTGISLIGLLELVFKEPQSEDSK